MNLKSKNKIKLSRIVADITSDGHLQLDRKRGVVSFYSKSIEKIKKENNLFNEIFNLSGHIYKYEKGSKRYGIMFTSKPLAIFLSSLGTPVGNKTLLKFKVPKWIFNGNKQIQKSYLIGMFTNDGSIYFSKHSGWRLEIEQYKLEKISKYGKIYMKQLKEMTERFNIKCSPVMCCRKNKRKDGSFTVAWEFYVWRQSFKNFYNKIGFDDPMKIGKLKKAIQMQGPKGRG